MMKAPKLTLVFLLSIIYPVNGRNLFQSLLNGIQDNRKREPGDKSSHSQDDRRRLSETTGSEQVNVYLDAATGTVPHVMTLEEDAQKTKAQEAATCDGQMAIALVQANEKQAIAEKELDVALKEHAVAIEKIVDLQTLLAQVEAKLAESTTALNESKETADKMLKETKHRAEEEIQTALESAEKAQNDLKEATKAALEQEKDQHRVEMEALKKEKDDTILSLQQKLTMTNEDLHQRLQDELEKARADRDLMLSNLQSKMEAVVAEMEKDRDAKVAHLENDRDLKIETLKKKMAVEAQEASDLLRATKEEAKAYLAEQANAAKSELARVQANHEKSLTEKNEKINNLRENARKVLQKISNLEIELQKAHEELNYWRTLHATRSYCNMTHISIDLYDSAVYVIERSVDAGKILYAHSKNHAEMGLNKVRQIYNEQVDKHWPNIKPHYEKQVKGNFQRHIEPHFKAHIYPKMKQVSSWYKKTMVPRLRKALRSTKKGYHALVRFYAEECESGLQAYKLASKKNDFLKKHPLPKSVLDSWSDLCANPEEALNVFLYATLLLLCILFHRRILGMARWTLDLGVAILLTITPFGLLFSRRRTSNLKPEDSDDDNAVTDRCPSANGKHDYHVNKSPAGQDRNAQSPEKNSSS